MRKNTVARVRLDGAGWAHPYGHGPFGPVHADGGDGGGSGSDGGQPGDGGPAPTGGGTGPSGQQPGQPAASPWEGFQWDGKVDSLPGPVAKVIRDAREEAGKARTVAKQNAANEARQELLDTISKAVGLDGGDKPPTAEQLTQQLAQSHSERTVAQEDAAAARIELHVYKTAARLGADADQLLDSRSFAEEIDAIDPNLDAQAFAAAVEQTIQAALERNPSLRSRGPGRSGGDLGGGSGHQAPTLEQEIAQAKADGNWRLAMRLENSKLAGLSDQQ